MSPHRVTLVEDAGGNRPVKNECDLVVQKLMAREDLLVIPIPVKYKIIT